MNYCTYYLTHIITFILFHIIIFSLFACFSAFQLELLIISLLHSVVFHSSLQAFINNFQEAKAALAEVTVQAAEKAASGVKELAERSTRIALNVHFNAPVIFLPQSSSSSNVIGADLGRLSVHNRFAKQPFKGDANIPPVVDIMTVRLTDLKMYRSESFLKFKRKQNELRLKVSLCD